LNRNKNRDRYNNRYKNGYRIKSMNHPTVMTLQEENKRLHKVGRMMKNKTLWRSSHQIYPPIRYKDYALMSHVMNVVEPSSNEEAK